MASTSLPLYLAAGVRAIEAAAANQPLMQRAGLAATEMAHMLLGERRAAVLILAGPGNNGGDGFETGIHLIQRGHHVCLIFAGEMSKQPPNAAAARKHFLEAGGKTYAQIPNDLQWGLIIDALFGIGLSRPIDGRYTQLIDAANTLSKRDNCPLLALDCPSGLSSETGAVLGPCINATHTITFIAYKPGLLTADGPDQSGAVTLASLALNAASFTVPEGRTISVHDFHKHLQPRRRNSHKGTYGSVGVIGGAPSMLGAPFLAGRAALQLGAGRVYLGLIDKAIPGFDPVQPELMLRNARQLLGMPPSTPQSTHLSALVCGPGLAVGAEQAALLTRACTLNIPLLLDADALNLLASDNKLSATIASRSAPTLITPHPAEAARLLASDVAQVQADRINAASELASRFNAHVALKGCGTILAAPDGHWAINTTGNPGMSTAGMGDVLAGIVIALIAQDWPADKALAAGIHLHGAAADLLAAEHGEIGLCAGETIPAVRLLLNHWIHENKQMPTL